MQGYNPAPPPGGGAPANHQAVAQHLAATIPGFGDPSKLNFRGAARAVQAANAFAGGAAPPAYGAPQGGSVYVAPQGGVTVVGSATAPQGAVTVVGSTTAPQGAVTVVGSTTVIGAPAPGGAGSTIVVGGAAPPAAVVGVAPVTVTPTASAPTAVASAPPAAAAPTAAAMEAPVDFFCPITQEMMVDPVICADGHSYERAAISQWLSSHATSPKTNAQLEHTNLIPNHTLRGSIEQFREQQQRK